MKLWEKVNELTGNGSSSRRISEYLNNGVKFLMGSLPQKFLWSISTEVEVKGFDDAGVKNVGAGAGVSYDKILAVYRYDGATIADSIITTPGSKRRVCNEVSDTMAYSLDETNSISRSTKMFPKYYKLGDKVFIKPDPDYNDHASQTGDYTDIDGTALTVNAGSGDKGVVVYSVPPTVDENTGNWQLVEYEHVVILYAASLDEKNLADKASKEHDLEVAASHTASSRDYYQRSLQELQALTGAVSAPPQQQAVQRQEERRST